MSRKIKVEMFCTCIICDCAEVRRHPIMRHFSGQTVRITKIQGEIINFKPLKGGEVYQIREKFTRKLAAEHPMAVF